MFKITSDYNDDFTTRPLKEFVSYHHKLRYETDEEVLSIQIDNLPPGIYFKDNIIFGNMEFLNKWHEVKDYVAKSIANLSDNTIPFRDCYEEEDCKVPLTVKYLKDHRFEMHYTAKNVLLFGAKAYVMDGNQIFQDILIKVKTKENYYEIKDKIRLAPLFSPKLYLMEYGKKFQLSLDKDTKLSPQDYIMHRIREGHKILMGNECPKQ